jgi:hypothetical protein
VLFDHSVCKRLTGENARGASAAASKALTIRVLHEPLLSHLYLLETRLGYEADNRISAGCEGVFWCTNWRQSHVHCTLRRCKGQSVLAARGRPGLRKELHTTMYSRELKSMCERLSCLVFLANFSTLYSLLIFDNLVLYIKASYTIILGDRLWPP